MALLRAVGIALASVGLALSVAWFAGDHAVRWLGLSVVLWVALLCFAINWLAFVPAALGRTEHFYDATGALTFLSVVALSLFTAAPLDLARALPALLVATWALRLGAFLFRRVRRAGKDGRFDEMKTIPARFFVAWTLQGLWVFLTSLAAVVLITTAGPTPYPSWVTVLGTALWLLGFTLEVVADNQKALFQADPKNSGRFINVGLWAWSRHPNYFGEMLLWFGLFLSGADRYVGGQWLAVLSPLFVVVLLTRVSGVPLLEQRGDAKWGSDPAWGDYKARTPVLIPRPPRPARR